MKFQENLAEYLEKTAWYFLNYNDFYLLYSLKFAGNHGLVLLIDDLYDVFSEEKMGIVFYQEKYRGRNRKESNIVPEGLTNCMRKLYTTGLISSIEPGKTQVQVFVTRQGWMMLDATLPLYLDQYIADFEKIKWHDFDLAESIE
ncbi:hypothetical protein [Enterococcus raffinosus]|uniref:hypothetical protein n=1 Tax=Enterococcus raffinosus TaxID=71452 RepID=UPI001C9654E1|nr:hypothetical protein [Enterococcus raffinosus]QZO11064.1 hypothetical protein K5P74_15600 [Enterococcus raffinosus]